MLAEKNPPETSGAAPPKGLLPALREALRGSRSDFTELPLRRAVFMLAVPMVAEMAMESIFAVVDVFWVSRLGSDAVATVGITESMLAIVYALAMGLSMGVAAVVARRIGEKDPDAAARAAVQGILLGLGISAVIGVTGAIAAPSLLAAMGASPGVIATGTGFTRVMLGGSATVVLLFLVNAIFRGAGDAAIAMRTLWLANLINIALGPCLVFGWGPFPQMGVTGAAVATTIGRGIGVVYQLATLFGTRSRLTIERRHLRVDRPVLASITRIARAGVVQSLIGTASWIGLVRILSGFGSAALAGYTIALRIVLFALLPSWGMSNAAATLVGQNLGAGKPDRAEQAVWRAATYNVIFLGTIGALFLVFAEPIIGLFSGDAAVAEYGVRCLRFVSAGFVFYAYGMVMVQAFNGAGDTMTPTLINLVCFWLWEIPLAWVLSGPAGFGPTGVFVAMTVAFSTLAVVGVIAFRRGRWKEKRV